MVLTGQSLGRTFVIVMFVSRYSRAVIHSALAVLVVAALSRCSWEESRELAQWTSTVAQHRLSLPSPIQSPVHDCDREAGCICRGATLVQAIDAAQFQSFATGLLPVNAGPTDFLADVNADRLSVALDELAWNVPPISGRQLRARYASLVI